MLQHICMLSRPGAGPNLSFLIADSTLSSVGASVGMSESSIASNNASLSS